MCILRRPYPRACAPSLDTPLSDPKFMVNYFRAYKFSRDLPNSLAPFSSISTFSPNYRERDSNLVIFARIWANDWIPYNLSLFPSLKNDKKYISEMTD